MENRFSDTFMSRRSQCLLGRGVKRLSVKSTPTRQHQRMRTSMQIMQENSRGHSNTGNSKHEKKNNNRALTIAGLLNAFLRDFAYAPLRIAKQRKSFENPALHAPRTAHGHPITRRINS